MARLPSEHRSFVAIYGLAHGAKSLIWVSSELLFAFFLTEAIGLPPSRVGLILALSLYVNAGMDLILGWTIRRVVTSCRTASRMQLFGAIAAGAALMTFASVGGLPGHARSGFALASVLAFRCAYPFLDNPQNSMLAFSAGDDGGRARIASVRHIAGGAAGLTLAALFAPLMLNEAAVVQSTRFWGLCAVLAGFSIAAAALLHLYVRRRPEIRIIGGGRAGTGGRAAPLSGRTTALALFATAFCLSLCKPVFAQLSPYFAAFAIRDMLDAGLVLSAVSAGSVFSQFGWSRLAQTTPLAVVLRIALLTMAAGAALFYVAAGQGAIAAAASVLIYGVGSGGVMMAVWSLLAGVASAPDSRFPGTAAFGLYTCCSKFGRATSAGLVGLILSGIDYRDQTVAIEQVAAWMAGAPIAAAVIVALLSAVMQRRSRHATARTMTETLDATAANR